MGVKTNLLRIEHFTQHFFTIQLPSLHSRDTLNLERRYNKSEHLEKLRKWVVKVPVLPTYLVPRHLKIQRNDNSSNILCIMSKGKTGVIVHGESPCIHT